MIPSVEGSSTFTYILYTKKRLFVKWTNRENMTEITDIFGGLKQRTWVIVHAKIFPKMLGSNPQPFNIFYFQRNWLRTIDAISQFIH